MSITHASIVSACQKAWQEESLGASTTKYDSALQMTCDDLSAKIELIRAVNWWSVTSVSVAAKKFTIAGNHAPYLGPTIWIDGSAGNDGFYTVVTQTNVGSNTEIVVAETVPDATNGGTLFGQALATTVDGGIVVHYPEGLMPGGLISITLMDASGNLYEPLQPFSGGLREYRLMYHRNTSASRPEYYIEGEGDKFYVWPPSNASYAVLLEYYRTHPQDVATILLPDACIKALKTGTVFHEAVLRNNKEYMATWGPLYGREFQALQCMYPGEPRGVYP